MSAFDKVERSPMFFQQWLIAMMAHSSLTPDSAIDHVLTELGAQFGFDSIWSDLTPFQRAVLRLLAEQQERIYSDASANRIDGLTSERKPSTAKILTAIRRLSRMGVVEKLGGAWRLNDPLLGAWVKARGDREFRGGK